jgi:hypothetical protein
MQVIFKTNNIATIGGTTPQGIDIKLIGVIGDWTVAEVPDSAISSIQEFNAQPVSDDFVAALNGPKTEGAYNGPALSTDTFGTKMLLENNPGQVVVGIEGIPDGTPVANPNDLDDRSKKNYSSEDVVAYQNVAAFIKKYDAKSVLRNQIRGNIADVEDDLADTKVASQLALYYFAHEWQTRSQAQKDTNPAKDSMEILSAKLLSDDVKMRGDLVAGIESINEIVEKEEAINQFVAANYAYNATRGA